MTTLTPEVKNFIRYGKVLDHIGSDLTNLGVPVIYDTLNGYSKALVWMKVWNKLLEIQKYDPQFGFNDYIIGLDTGVIGPPYVQGLINVILLKPLSSYQVSICPEWAKGYNKASIKQKEVISDNLNHFLAESADGNAF